MFSAVLIKEGLEPRAWDMPTLQKRRTRDQIREQTWRCKFCEAPMQPRLGLSRIWHFAHVHDVDACPSNHEADVETQEHRLLKRASATAMQRYLKDEVVSVEYEVRIPEARRIADVLLVLKDGTRVAVEAQVSAITFENLQERTEAYVREELEVVWVFNQARMTPGSLWEGLREWLLAQGHLVLTATTIVKETTISLGQVDEDA
jgi:competence CoiA-like predicted nuclease